MSELKELAQRVIALEKRMSEFEARHVNVMARPDSKDEKEMSVKEFIIAKKPSNEVQKTLAIGYFLERFAGTMLFNVDDLSKYFQLAKEAIPGNINDKVNMNIKKGHMAEAREKKNKKKAWMVTNTGERFVERGFKDS